MARRIRHQNPWRREDRPLTIEQIRWLQTSVGQDVLRVMLEEPADTPAAIAHWRERLEPALVSAAWTQVSLRKLAERKFSQADRMLFDRVGLEQATDEVIGAYKARRFAGIGRVADLCCGIGGDAVALATVSRVIALDWSAARVALTEHNAGVYGRELEGRVGDAAFDWPDADAVHIDPDRRATGTRSHRAETASPDLDTLARIVERYVHAAIKLSPGADLDHLPFDAEVEVISRDGECKQAVLWTGRFRSAYRRATVLSEKWPQLSTAGASSAGESLAAESPQAMAWPDARPPVAGDFLFEPDPALIRANLVGLLARRERLQPVDPHIAYLVGNRPVESVFLTPFRVVDVMHWSAKKVRARLTAHDVGQLEIKTRGFAASPDEILKAVHPHGRRRGVVLLTRITGEPTAILAERLVV